MEMDWVQPFGKGKYPDIFVKYNGEGFHCSKDIFVGDDHLKGSLTMTWQDEECGFYSTRIDDSELKSPHLADTNQTLLTSLTLENQMDASRSKIENLRGCIIFRFRPRFSAEGKLLGVHYGKIYGPLGFNYLHPIEQHKGLAIFRINIYSNPTENDTNLEFLPYHSLNYPNERHKQPNIAP